MRWNGDIIHWDITFIGSIHDWELESLQSFLDLIYSIKIDSGDDWMSWKPTRSSIFDVKSFYRVLSNENHHYFQWKSIWRVKAPKKIAFLICIVARGKILIMNNLQRRNICIVEWCCMCRVYRSLASSL